MVKVKEVMKRIVVTAGPDITLEEAAKMMTKNRVGSVVIVDKSSGKPVGIVTNEDIVGVVAEGKNPKDVRAKDLKSKRFITASPEDTLIDVTKKMIKTGVKRVPIVDTEGRLVGIISEKEIVLVSPEMLNVLSEKLKMRVESVMPTEGSISGICERCEGYSDDLRNVGGQWLCEGCRNSQ